jgi:hypothetical protein
VVLISSEFIIFRRITEIDRNTIPTCQTNGIFELSFSVILISSKFIIMGSINEIESESLFKPRARARRGKPRAKRASQIAAQLVTDQTGGSSPKRTSDDQTRHHSKAESVLVTRKWRLRIMRGDARAGDNSERWRYQQGTPISSHGASSIGDRELI